MKHLKYILPAIILAQLGTAARAEEDVTLKIRRIYVADNIYTPFYDAQTEQNHEPGSAQRWVRVAVEYSTSGGWVDELTIDHRALVYHHGSEQPVILSEAVTYAHVGKGNHVSYVYMHPNCVQRYDVRAKNVDIAIQISIDGKPIAAEKTNRKTKGDWPENPKYKVSGSHLLNESETPFWFINYDHKEMIKHESHE